MDAETKKILTQILGTQVIILSKVLQIEENQKEEPGILNAKEFATRTILNESKMLFDEIQNEW